MRNEVFPGVLGQFGTRTIWYRGQFGTAHVDGQFGTGQFGTRTIWHRGQFGTWHIFPNYWQCISNIDVYSLKFEFPHPVPEGRTNTLQLTQISQLLAEYIQYLCITIMSQKNLGMVPNCPRCQIVRFCWWWQIVWCQIVRSAKLSWCQIVCSAKLSGSLIRPLDKGIEVGWPYIQKAKQIGDYFLSQKNWRKKCVNQDDKIMIEHGSFVSKYNANLMGSAFSA